MQFWKKSVKYKDVVYEFEGNCFFATLGFWRTFLETIYSIRYIRYNKQRFSRALNGEGKQMLRFRFFIKNFSTVRYDVLA